MAAIATVSKNANPTNTVAALELAGHTVTKIDDANVATQDFSSFDLIVALRLDNAAATTIASELRKEVDAGIPLVIGLVDLGASDGADISVVASEMSLISSATLDTGEDQDNFTDVDHLITSTWRTGAHTTMQATNRGGGVKSGGSHVGTKLAEGVSVDLAGLTSLIAIESGTNDLLGAALGARVVVWGNLYGQADYEDIGDRLIAKMVVWALGSAPATAPADSQIARGTITLAGNGKPASGTGETLTVTGVGLPPKVLIMWTAGSASGFSASDSVIAYGVTDGVRERSVAMLQNDTTIPTSLKRTMTGKVLAFQVTGQDTESFVLDFQSFDADGFTLYSEGSGAAHVVHWLAIGGADISAHVGEWDPPTSTGNDSTTGVGFTPDLLMFLEGFVAGELPQVSNDAEINIGFATASTEGAFGVAGLGSQTPSEAVRTQRSDRCLIGLTPTTSAVNREATIISMDADGFTLNWVTVVSPTFPAFYLALKGADVFVGAETQKTSTGTKATTGVGFTPSALMFLSFNAAATNSVVAHARVSIGVSQDGGGEASVWTGATDAANPASTDNALSTTKALMLVDTDGASAVDAEADVTVWGSDGFTLDWTTADATARQFIFLALAIGSILPTSVTIADTITSSADEDEVREHDARQLVMTATLNAGSWDSTIGANNVITEEFLAQLVSATDQTLGWNNVVQGRWYPGVVLDNSPVGYWRGGPGAGGTDSDTSTNSNDGTATATETGPALIAVSAQPSTKFATASDIITVSDASAIQNVFSSGGTVEAIIKPNSLGIISATSGRLVSKRSGAEVGWELLTFDDSTIPAGYIQLAFQHSFSTTGGIWALTVGLALGRAAHVAVTYDNSDVANNPTFYINGTAYTVDNGGVTETATPVGTAGSDVGVDLGIGQRVGTINTYDGMIQEVALYTSELSAANILIHVNEASYTFGLSHAALVRTSSRVLTMTMPLFGLYDIDTTETITVTANAATHNGSSALTGSPTFDIDPTDFVSNFDPGGGDGSGGGAPHDPDGLGGDEGGDGEFGDINGGLGPGAGDAQRRLGAGDEYALGSPNLAIGLSGGQRPRMLRLSISEVQQV